MTADRGLPQLDVVIVDWNAHELVSKCIAALDRVATELPSLNVIVVDNASTGRSPDALQASNFPVQVIRNSTNVGFAAASNQGAALGAAARILFLNPDVVVTSADALLSPLAFLAQEGHASAGICGIQLRDEKGAVSRTLSPFPTPTRAFGWMTALDRIAPRLFPPHFFPVSAHFESRSVDSVMGAFFVIRRNLFDRLGGFSTRFFLYYEDVDLCRRAKNAGYSTWYLGDASVIHEGCGTTRNIRARRYFYSTRSRIIYGLRHFSPVWAYLTAMGWLLIDPVVRLLFAIATLSPQRLSETVKGTAMLWRDSANFLREKRL